MALSKSSHPCWHCGANLMQYENGRLCYETYTDPIGNKHMVHKACLPRIEEKLTANQGEVEPLACEGTYRTPPKFFE